MWSKELPAKNITLQQQKKICSTFRATCYSRCLLAIAGPCNVARIITKLRNCEYVHMLMLYEVIFLKNIFSSLYYCLHTTSLYFILVLFLGLKKIILLHYNRVKYSIHVAHIVHNMWEYFCPLVYPLLLFFFCFKFFTIQLA